MNTFSYLSYMESKYVSLNQVVNEALAKPKVGLFNDMQFVFPELTPNDMFRPGERDHIITEDIDCEVIQPKLLPPAIIPSF